MFWVMKIQAPAVTSKELVFPETLVQEIPAFPFHLA